MRLRCFFALVLAMSAAVPAFASERDSREARAREAFALGRYAEAMELYGKLFAETAHPTYLRNIGRCHQNLGEADEAISSFREYLRQAKNLPAEQKAQVEGYIREMEELKARKDRPRREGQRTAVAAPPAAAANPASPPPIAASIAPALDIAAGPAPADGPHTSSARKVAGLSIAGAGVLGVALGAVFGFKAGS